MVRLLRLVTLAVIAANLAASPKSTPQRPQQRVWVRTLQGTQAAIGLWLSRLHVVVRPRLQGLLVRHQLVREAK